MVNGLLNRYPLTEDGYIALAANLFWNNWPSLTGMFIRINNFLTSIHSENRDPAILTHWAGVRFLLDSQRAKLHERRNSRCFKRVEWNDMRLTERDGWHVLEWAEGKGGGKEDLETIQASMLEMVMPVLPHRLNEDWRRVIESIDILDIPGMRAGRQGAEQGKRQSADAIEEQMEIVKRGKVAYLFERYTDEMLIQTLLLLARGGNLEVTAQMKYHIDKWGRARYGEDAWPTKVKDKLPALFLGVTGIDEEFRNRDEYANHMLYETRLTQVADALGEVMSDFGGIGQPFTNVYPLRYPGTWDADQEQREKAGVEKWVRAEDAFMKSKMVAKHCANPAEKWKAAMTDNDGGLSLISPRWREVTTATKKQAQLEDGIKEVRTRLHQLSQGWVVNADSNIDREQRKQCADRVLEWLTSNPQAIYDRVRVLEKTLGFDDGEQYAVSDFADIPIRAGVGRPEPLERRFTKKLQEYLHEWATVSDRGEMGAEHAQPSRRADRGWAARTSDSSPVTCATRCARRLNVRAGLPAVAQSRQSEAPRRDRQTPGPPQVRGDHDERLRHEPRAERRADAGGRGSQSGRFRADELVRDAVAKPPAGLPRLRCGRRDPRAAGQLGIGQNHRTVFEYHVLRAHQQRRSFMHILFANTGVQVVCVPLQSGRRYTTAQIGYGWQHCRCKPEAGAEEEHDEDEVPPPLVFPYIQWQIIQSNVSKIFLAVDTSLGDPDLGYFSDPSTLAGDFHVRLKDMLDREGQPLQGIPEIELCLRASSATAGEAKPVHMVVDFGNSRTGALLIEMAGEVSQTAEMTPFELINRYNLDHFNDEGEQISKPGRPVVLVQDPVGEHALPRPAGNGRRRNTTARPARACSARSRSPVSGKRTCGRICSTTGPCPGWGAKSTTSARSCTPRATSAPAISSPKRYLWAADDSWLEGAFWYMADPHDRDNTGSSPPSCTDRCSASFTKTTAIS